MYESPRDRRLKADLEAMRRLKGQSSIIEFTVLDDPPTHYVITFRGKGLMQPAQSDAVASTDHHQVEIRLGANYPRSKPDLKWRTPLFHPNISALGQVCLGGYSTHWVPSLNLDELSEMLWDMLRYANFDTKSPYNYKAARWVERQAQYSFPTDDRPLRDLVARGLVRDTDVLESPPVAQAAPAPVAAQAAAHGPSAASGAHAQGASGGGPPAAAQVAAPSGAVQAARSAAVKPQGPPEEIVFIGVDSEQEGKSKDEEKRDEDLLFIGND